MSFYKKLDLILENFTGDEKAVELAGKLITKYPHSFKMLKYDPKGYTDSLRVSDLSAKEAPIEQDDISDDPDELPEIRSSVTTPEGYIEVVYPGTAHSLATVIGLIGKPSGVKEPARVNGDYIQMVVKDEIVSSIESVLKLFGIEYSKDFQSKYDVGGKGTRGKVVDTQFRLFPAEKPAQLIPGNSPKKSGERKAKPIKVTNAGDARKRLADLKAQLQARKNQIKPLGESEEYDLNRWIKVDGGEYTSCPKCHDEDNLMTRDDGQWKCDSCTHEWPERPSY